MKTILKFKNFTHQNLGSSRLVYENGRLYIELSETGWVREWIREARSYPATKVGYEQAYLSFTQGINDCLPFILEQIKENELVF